MWCDICLEVHSREAMYYLRCGHGFCVTSLLRAYDSYGTDPSCPAPSCRAPVDEEDLYVLLGEEQAARIVRFRIEKRIRVESQLRLCPDENCTQILSAGVEPCEVYCESCEKTVFLDAIPAADPALASVLSDLGMRICVSCGNGVEKKDGCDKMMCRCGAKFCYRCGTEFAMCNCTDDAHIFWDNITGTPEGAAFKISSLSQAHKIRFRKRIKRLSPPVQKSKPSACCTIS